MLKMLENILGEKYHFHGFSKGARALKFLTYKVPSLLILDIDMPELNGFELLKIIKNDENLKNVPVIFLTSNGDRDHVIGAFKTGANDYKPVKEEILMEKVLKLMNDKSNKDMFF